MHFTQGYQRDPTRNPPPRPEFITDFGRDLPSHVRLQAPIRSPAVRLGRERRCPPCTGRISDRFYGIYPLFPNICGHHLRMVRCVSYCVFRVLGLLGIGLVCGIQRVGWAKQTVAPLHLFPHRTGAIAAFGAFVNSVLFYLAVFFSPCVLPSGASLYSILAGSRTSPRCVSRRSGRCCRRDCTFNLAPCEKDIQLPGGGGLDTKFGLEEPTKVPK
ncbi:hypothetical protein F5B21DRAFT_495699 [Xylaria acuta]|nr:hypothetical protein F5B21DRAFT_495699 [Xylaria acuta]